MRQIHKNMCFTIEKMQFNQPIYKSNLEFELMGVEGVRSIGHVTITQHRDYFSDDGDDSNHSFGFNLHNRNDDSIQNN